MYTVRQRTEWLEYLQNGQESSAAQSWRYCLADSALYASRANDDGRYWESLCADKSLRGELFDTQFEP